MNPTMFTTPHTHLFEMILTKVKSVLAMIDSLVGTSATAGTQPTGCQGLWYSIGSVPRA